MDRLGLCYPFDVLSLRSNRCWFDPRRQANIGAGPESRRPGFNVFSPRSYESNRVGGGADGRLNRCSDPRAGRNHRRRRQSSRQFRDHPVLFRWRRHQRGRQETLRHRLFLRCPASATGAARWWFRWSRTRPSSITSFSSAIRKVKSEDLQKEVQLRDRGAYNQATADADVQRILDIYRRSGHNAATVSVRTVQTPNKTVDVVFDINEGDKTGIKRISFVGNHAYSDSKLKGLMEFDGNEFPVVHQDL